jgi:hypothetical protein
MRRWGRCSAVSAIRERELAVTLTGQGNPAAAVRLVTTGLTGPVADGVRTRVVWCPAQQIGAHHAPGHALTHNHLFCIRPAKGRSNYQPRRRIRILTTSVDHGT